MRKDVMADANLAVYAEVALFIFVAVFILIVIRALVMNKESINHLEHMPLEDGSTGSENEVRS